MDYRAELARRGIADPEAGSWKMLGWGILAIIAVVAVMIAYPPRPTRCFDSVQAFLREHPDNDQWFQNTLETRCPDGKVPITFRRWG